MNQKKIKNLKKKKPTISLCIPKCFQHFLSHRVFLVRVRRVNKCSSVNMSDQGHPSGHAMQSSSCLLYSLHLRFNNLLYLLYVSCTCGLSHVWRSEDNLRSWFSPFPRGSWRLNSDHQAWCKRPYYLNHLTSPKHLKFKFRIQMCLKLHTILLFKVH